MSEPAVTQTAQPLADRIWDIYRAQAMAEHELYELLETIGFGESWADWSADSYDSSLELYGVPPDARLSDEAATKLREIGFDIVWLNHSDGTETTYTRNGVSTRKTDGDRAKQEQDSQNKRLHREVSQLRQQLAQASAENAELQQKGNASHACYCGELPSGKKCMACQLQTAKRSLKELREKMRWIPVAEKFPEFAGTYIVAVDGLGDDGENYIGTLPADWSPDGKYWHDLRGWGSNEVTHWMPLPDPPVAEAGRLMEEG